MRRKIVLLVAAGLLVGASAGRLHAWWTDVASIDSSSLQTHTVARPTSMTCSGTLALSVTLTTPAADPRYSYVVRVYSNDGSTQLLGDFPMTQSGGTWTRSLSTADLGGFLNIGSTYRLRVSARLASTPTWQSSQFREWTVSVLSLLGAGVLSCGSNQTP